jgi:phage gp36-like protein
VAYCSQSDIELKIPSTILAQLTDDTAGLTIQAAAVTRVIADADAQINSFARGKTTLPFSPVPENVRRWSVALAVLGLYARRVDLRLPEAVRVEADNVMTELRALRDNKLLIDDAQSPANTASFFKTNKTSDSKVFWTSDTDKNGRLDRFWGPTDGLDYADIG